ncbi:MAG TPA: ABC transporter ATP-binding protein [Spirochaetota bacterium]|nr:ABC transporter ATP-binding protein [Spirochaetota bacterium]HPI88790.1 ABC transporter ATP-binding protein [Spirochaetota bacterium]HPR47136.1 ABC transporter ATP-binding protein [Spirochaetota bacterium]
MNRIIKIFYLLSKKEKRKLVFLIFALIICSFIGVIGIASIMPFLSVLSKPDIIKSNEILSWIYSTLGFTSINNFMLYLGIALLAVFIFSNMFLTTTIWMELHFIRMVGYNMTRNLLMRYLNNPYSFFLTRNSSELTKNLFSEVQQVISSLVKPIMEIIVKGILAFSILVFIVVINPRLALIMGLFLGGAYAVIFMFIKRKLSKNGQQRVSANARRFKIADEALGSIKDIKLLGKEKIYIDRFSHPAMLYEKSVAIAQILSRMPKYVMETVAFGGMLAIVLFLFATKNDISDILPLVALYAFAGYRLLPSLQDMFAAVALIRSNLDSLDIIYNDLNGMNESLFPNRTDYSVLAFSNRMHIRKMGFKYESASDFIFKNFSLSIKANTTVGIVGPTGCGKTTLIDIILGLLIPSEGGLMIDGVLIDGSNRHHWQNNCGYVPQRIYLADDTITRNIAFGMPDDKINMDAVIKAAKIANIHDLITGDMQAGYDTVVGDRGIRLSGGQNQRIGIARAIYNDPAVLILDEATSALDGYTEKAIMDAVNNLSQKKTIIMIAHRLATVKKCDVIYVLKKGKIVESGTYDELIKTSAYFKEQGAGKT